MPSPFPGMDPYLEHPALFPGLHNRMIAVLSETLQTALPQPYYAEIGERVWVEVSRRFIEPNVNLLRRDDPATVRQPGAGGVALAEPGSGRAVVVTVPHDERREPYIEIRAALGDGERLVTAIEILSLSNKTPGERGRELYRRKQEEILSSDVHLVEIDLLRAGEHTTAVPLDRLRAKVGQFDYHVCVHRFDRFEDYLVYPIQLDECLPTIDVPLLPTDPDVTIDLQAVFDRCYDSGPYARRVRYAASAPEPPLRPDEAERAMRLLKAKDRDVSQND